jgi:hypothetical protein
MERIRLYEYVVGNTPISSIPVAHVIRGKIYKPIDTKGKFEVVHERTI